jgi:hypothetical protein
VPAETRRLSRFSLRHFYEQLSEKHGIKVSCNWLRLILQEADVVQKEADVVLKEPDVVQKEPDLVLCASPGDDGCWGVTEQKTHLSA